MHRGRRESRQGSIPRARAFSFMRQFIWSLPSAYGLGPGLCGADLAAVRQRIDNQTRCDAGRPHLGAAARGAFLNRTEQDPPA